MATLTYCDVIGITPTAGLHAKHTFLMNNIGDPDYTGIGHQPFGHDELMSFYDKYIVKRAHIHVKFWHEGTNNLPMNCGVWLDRSTDPTMDITTKKERTRGRGIATLGVEPDKYCYASTWYSPNTYFIKEDAVDDHRLSGTTDTSPALPAYAHVWAQCPDAVSASTKPIIAEVRIVYYVLFSEAKIMTQS